ncbi:AraC family transcriptional regulator [Rhizobium alvei]|uniref:AraC family transcriptional regulator n=1 Tax=Rhizobium alvei TaxID=1132659 RepID=A0ABT8YTP3_9HYPH|nr:AraC family transcriptional regulator [Rhizobium alvei]MDO6967106.1 AraC family transcriptional regulator [Rhizobium alvei]
MNIIESAIWQVESNLRTLMSLEAIADRIGVTPAYLTRAFTLVTGHSLMRYARARRLSEAARILALGVPDILNLALDMGYGSHEAFTRAFRDHFGITPETVRDGRSTAKLELTEPLAMDKPLELSLAAPLIEQRSALRLAGLIKTFPMKEIATIPALWPAFDAVQDLIADRVSPPRYFGASLSFSEERGCEYMAALEVTSFAAQPKEINTATVPAATYAIFRQPGHITLMRPTIMSIWQDWLQNSGYQAAEAPLIEYYPPEFDGQTGNGGFEIWLPVRQS